MTKLPKFTPGPWGIRDAWAKGDYGKEVYPLAGEGDLGPGFHRGQVADVKDYGEDDETAANAAMIAAAPDMYEALQEALGFLIDLGVSGDLPDTMRAVLAKATGGAS